MPGRRAATFPGWMPGLYRKVGKKVTTYYTILPGNEYKGLGNDLVKARQALIALDGETAPVASKPGTIGAMLDEQLGRDRRRVAHGSLSQRTLDDYEDYIEQLKKPFGKMAPEDLTKKHVWDYLHTYRGAQAPSRANQEISYLWGCYEVLVETEVLKRNPCEGVKRNETKPRDRAVSREEFYAFLDFCRSNGHITKTTPAALKAKAENDVGKRIAYAFELSYLTTHAQGEVIKLTRTRLNDEGIKWPPRKGGAPTLTEWTPALRACVEGAIAMPAKVRGQEVTPVFVIYNRQGQPYTSRGIRTMFQRLMKAWGEAGNQRFTFHDGGRAHGITRLREKKRVASEVSGHLQEKTVAKVYDRRTFRKAPAVE